MSGSVEVKFEGSYQTYTYLVPPGMVVKSGDTVIVDSPSKGFVAVKVTSRSPCDTRGKGTKYIVDVVDTSKYEYIKKLEAHDKVLKEIQSLEARLETLYQKRMEFSL